MSQGQPYPPTTDGFYYDINDMDLGAVQDMAPQQVRSHIACSSRSQSTG